jgi:uncharacterized protein (DUF488 family)
MPVELLSIGHSTHPLERFLDLLGRHRIELVADIRRFPGSRKFPHFNGEALSSALAAAGVGYRWFEELGGRRSGKRGAPSFNLGLRNESFRHYADYMATDAFRAGVDRLLAAARDRRTVLLCSDGVFWRCHRRLVSDYLSSLGVVVGHIMPSGELHPHTLTNGAILGDPGVSYPLAKGEPDRPLLGGTP